MQPELEKFILPPYVSGFYKDGGRTAEKVPFGLFSESCKKLADESDFTLVKAYDFSGQPNRSYHLAAFTGKLNLLAMCNKYYPIVAFSVIESPSTNFDFNISMPKNEYLDGAEMAPFFSEHFTVLDKAYLAITVDADNPSDAKVVSRLSDNEFAEFAYWEPKVVADIVFNNWG